MNQIDSLGEAARIEGCRNLRAPLFGLKGKPKGPFWGPSMSSFETKPYAIGQAGAKGTAAPRAGVPRGHVEDQADPTPNEVLA